MTNKQVKEYIQLLEQVKNGEKSSGEIKLLEGDDHLDFQEKSGYITIDKEVERFRKEKDEKRFKYFIEAMKDHYLNILPDEHKERSLKVIDYLYSQADELNLRY